jgi:hypothetical protein
MEVVPWSDPCLPCYRHMNPYQKRHQHLTPDTWLLQRAADPAGGRDLGRPGAGLEQQLPALTRGKGVVECAFAHYQRSAARLQPQPRNCKDYPLHVTRRVPTRRDIG